MFDIEIVRTYFISTPNSPPSQRHCSPPSHTKQRKRNALRSRSVEPLVCKPQNDLPSCGTSDCIAPRYSETRPFEKEGLGSRFVYGSASGNKSFRILCYGDSNTAGYRGVGKTLSPYGQELADALHGAGFPCEVTSCGLCGFTSEELVNEIRAPSIHPKVGPSGMGLAHLLQEGDFDLVIIMVGTNDLGRSTDPKLTQALVTRLHSTCHGLGIPTVNIAPTTLFERSHFNDFTRSIREAREQLTDFMHTWATACPNVFLSLDCETLVPKNMSLFWEPDDIHLSKAGSKQLGAKLASQLTKVLGQRRRKTSPLSSPQTCQRQLQPIQLACGKSVGVMAFPNSNQTSKQSAMATMVTHATMVPVVMCIC